LIERACEKKERDERWGVKEILFIKKSTTTTGDSNLKLLQEINNERVIYNDQTHAEASDNLLTRKKILLD